MGPAAATPTPSPPTDASAAAFDAAANRIRDTAKWVLASFAAIGAALIVGIQFADIGSLRGAPLVGAIVALLFGFAGIVVAIRSVGRLLLPQAWTLASLIERHPKAVRYLEENPEHLVPYRRIADLKRDADAARAEYERAFWEWRRDPTPANDAALTAAHEARAPVAAMTRQVLTWARYAALRADYEEVINRRVLPALASAALGLVLFAFMIKSPGTASSGADLHGLTLANVDLSGARLPAGDLRNANLSGARLTNVDLSAADLTGANLTGADLTGANLRGAKLAGATLDRAVWRSTTCPDGVMSDAAGGSCVAHLTVQEPGD